MSILDEPLVSKSISSDYEAEKALSDLEEGTISHQKSIDELRKINNRKDRTIASLTKLNQELVSEISRLKAKGHGGSGFRLESGRISECQALRSSGGDQEPARQFAHQIKGNSGFANEKRFPGGKNQRIGNQSIEKAFGCRFVAQAGRSFSSRLHPEFGCPIGRLRSRKPSCLPVDATSV